MSRTVRKLGSIAAGLPAVITLPLTAYLTTLTLVGARKRPTNSNVASVGDTTFVVMIPAHNEAAGIADTLRSLERIDYPSNRYAVHVVADNCTDDTAAVVRSHGVEVHERHLPDDPGKGPALNWLFDRLTARGDAFNAVVIVDADTVVDAAFLRAVEPALLDGAVAVQGFYTVRQPEASPATSFRYAALACRHHLRSQGRCRIGASCGLFGNGMAFRREVLEQRRWSGHLVEDAEFQIELLLDGNCVAYAPDAVVRAEMPHDSDQATSQNRRWERGRIELARRSVPVLVDRLIRGRGRRVPLADAIMDQITPPLSVLVAVESIGVVAGAGATALGSRSARASLVVQLVGLATLMIHVIVGLASIGAERRHFRSLLMAPRVVLWKVGLWTSVLGRDTDVAWTRTRRNADPRSTEQPS